MRLLAIDPGPVESAYVVYHPEARSVTQFWKGPNVEFTQPPHAHACAIEMVASYGMAVGAEVFETCVWVGRLMERWLAEYPWIEPRRVYRRDVKLHLCGNARAKDANIRQALVDRYGGKEKAIGRKASPGPLYGITGDCWAALAVAVTAAEAGA